jgi:hypothetical protein
MSCERSDSSCCKTGRNIAARKDITWQKHTGSRLIVAVAAPVIILVAPGPMDEVQA